MGGDDEELKGLLGLPEEETELDVSSPEHCTTLHHWLEYPGLSNFPGPVDGFGVLLLAGQECSQAISCL